MPTVSIPSPPSQVTNTPAHLLPQYNPVQAREQHLNDPSYPSVSRMQARVVSVVENAGSQTVQSQTGPSTIQVAELPSHSVASPTNNRPNLITATLVNSSLFADSSYLHSPTSEGLSLAAQNIRLLNQSTSLLEHLASNISDVSSLLLFTIQLRQIHQNARTSLADLQDSLADNYALSEALVSQLLQLK